MRVWKIFMTVLLIGALTLAAAAADGNVTYQGSADGFIFAPGSDHSLTDLFPNFKGVMPGDTLTQRIVICNDATKEVKVKIYVRSLGAHPESVDFLSQMSLRVDTVTDTIMFAPADQRAQMTDWVYLGLLYSGGEAELEVQLDVPVTMGNAYADQIGYLDWEFMIEEFPVEETDPKPPPTGEGMEVFLIIGILLISGGLVILLISRRRKKEELQKGG